MSQEIKKEKPVFYTELAYVLGIILLAFGTAAMEKADFGVSMIVAPAYLVYQKVSQFLPFFTFGMAEYLLQAILLCAMVLVLRKFRVSYLFSIVTAILYGFILDGAMILLALIPSVHIAPRLVFYIAGLAFCTSGVSLLFHTYIAPEVYELFVKCVSAKKNIDINKFKIAYDCISCLVASALSFLFFGFGHFVGIHVGTVVCALCNGFLIGCFSRLFEKFFVFRDGLPLRRFFE